MSSQTITNADAGGADPRSAAVTFITTEHFTRADTRAPQGLELRHLRYLVAPADAGTRAAEQLFIAQPTLSQPVPAPISRAVRTG